MNPINNELAIISEIKHSKSKMKLLNLKSLVYLCFLFLLILFSVSFCRAEETKKKIYGECEACKLSHSKIVRYNKRFPSAQEQLKSKNKDCIVAGCSGQLCIDNPNKGISTCEWREEYACYRNATCKKQSNGQCGWTMDEDLKHCLNGKTGRNF